MLASFLREARSAPGVESPFGGRFAATQEGLNSSLAPGVGAPKRRWLRPRGTQRGEKLGVRGGRGDRPPGVARAPGRARRLLPSACGRLPRGALGADAHDGARAHRRHPRRRHPVRRLHDLPGGRGAARSHPGHGARPLGRGGHELPAAPRRGHHGLGDRPSRAPARQRRPPRPACEDRPRDARGRAGGAHLVPLVARGTVKGALNVYRIGAGGDVHRGGVRARQALRRRRGARARQRPGARCPRAPGADRLAHRPLQPPLLPRAPPRRAEPREQDTRPDRRPDARHRRLQARQRRPRARHRRPGAPPAGRRAPEHGPRLGRRLPPRAARSSA